MNEAARSRIGLVALLAVVFLPLVLPPARFPRMAAATAALAAAAALVAAFAARRAPAGGGTGAGDAAATRWACAAALVFLLLTLVPMPLALTRATGRERCEQNRAAAERLAEARSLGLARASADTFAFTRNGTGTARVLFMTATAFSAFFVARSLAQAQALALLRILLVAGSLVGAAGWVGLWVVPQGNTVWWFLPIPASPHGGVACFANRNHLAAYLAVLAPAAAVLSVHDASRRQWLRALLSIACFACLSAALASTLSRGGMASGVVGMAAAAAIVAAVTRRFRPVLPLLLLSLAVAGAVLAFPSARLRERLDTLRHVRQTDSYVTRTAAWKACLRIWKTYPFAGAGANAFRAVYPQHRVTSEGSYMTHAENEYAQLLADGGLAGVALLAFTLLALRRDVIAPGLRHDAHPVLAAASLGALCVAAANAVVDFPLHIPQFGVLVGALAGLRAAPVRAGGPGAPGPAPAAFPWLPALTLAVVAAAALPMHRRMSFDLLPWIQAQKEPAALAEAAANAPTSSYAWYHLGERAFAAETPGAQAFAERCVVLAVRYDPNNYRLWAQLGHLRLARGNRDGAREAFARARRLRAWVPVPDGLD